MIIDWPYDEQSTDKIGLRLPSKFLLTQRLRLKTQLTFKALWLMITPK